MKIYITESLNILEKREKLYTSQEKKNVKPPKSPIPRPPLLTFWSILFQTFFFQSTYIYTFFKKRDIIHNSSWPVSYFPSIILSVFPR